MSAALPHPLFPEQDAEEVARHRFFRDLKELVTAEIRPQIATRPRKFISDRLVS